MSDKDQTKSDKIIRPVPEGAAQGLPVVVHAQYIRDASFENPNAPGALRIGQQMPQMDVNISMDARKLEGGDTPDLYEVILRISARAVREEETVFIAEIEHGTVVSLNDVPEAQHHPLLLIEIPRLAFPFARQILADLTVQGGYPPLLLNPVDFQALYMDRFGADREKGEQTH